MNSIDRILSLALIRLSQVRDEQGQTLAEYSLILSLVAVGVVVMAVTLFSSTIGGTYDSVTACLDGGCS